MPNTTKYLIFCPYLPNALYWPETRYFELIDIIRPGSAFATVPTDSAYPGKTIETYFKQKRNFVNNIIFPVAVLYRDIYTVPRLDVYSRLHLTFFHSNNEYLRSFVKTLADNGVDLEKF